MFDVVAVGLMICLSSAALVTVSWFLGRRYWEEGCQQMVCSLLLYGLAFACMMWLSVIGYPEWFSGAYVLYAGGISCSIWALYRFQQAKAPTLLLLSLPVLTAFIFEIFIEDLKLRIQVLATFFLFCYFWMLYVLLQQKNRPVRPGAKVMLTGIALLICAMLLRVAFTSTSMTASFQAHAISSLIYSYAILFFALHLTSTGFWLMCSHRADMNAQRMAYEDGLTGLANRGTLLQLMERMLKQSHHHHESISLLMIDIDHFKQINNVFGQQAGDQVLIAVGNVLQESVRPQDLLGRYGGEEFIVVCPDTQPQDAQELAEQLCATIRDSVQARSEFKSWPVTVSIGLCTCTQVHASRNVESLLRKVDLALGEAKVAGRNRTCHYIDHPLRSS